MFGAPLAEMARAHKVIALHARGHGVSKDSDEPWSYETFADDVAAVMDHLGIEKASVMGYSSGALATPASTDRCDRRTASRSFRARRTTPSSVLRR